MKYTDDYFKIKEFENDLGVILFYREGPNKTCEIVDIASKNPGYGAGTAIYKKFENKMKNDGIKNIYAFTRFTNVQAIKWYARMGFSCEVINNFYYDEPNFKAVIATKNL